jgi:hypothetical protein
VVLIFFFLVNLGAFPEVGTDIILSSDNDDSACSSEPDAPIVQQGSAADYAEDVGTTSAEALVPSPIGSGA